MKAVEIFEFEGKAFEIKSETAQAFGGTEVTRFAAFYEGEKVTSNRDLMKVKIAIIENYETVNSESYKRGMAAAAAAKAEGRDGREAAIAATVDYINSLNSAKAETESEIKPKLSVSADIAQDIAGAAKQFKESLNDEYAAREAQYRIDATVAALVAMLEVEPALGHLPRNVTDELANTIANTFEFAGAVGPCVDYVYFAFFNILQRVQDEVLLAA